MYGFTYCMTILKREPEESKKSDRGERDVDSEHERRT